MTKAAELAKMGEVLTNSQIGGRRNILINGAMNVAQRATSSTGISTSGYYTVDRFQLFMGNTDGRVTASQVADVHDGFANALKLECTTADTSIASSEFFGVQTKIEGQDVQQFKKGSSDAESITVSFYVKGNASATFAVELFDNDNSRQASQLFSVTTSWTRVTKTFTPDTTGAFDDNNESSLVLAFWLHGGSNFTSGTLSSTFVSSNNVNRAAGISSFLDSTDRTFFITGIQLEVGSVATPFEHRSFGEELLLCQRYYYSIVFQTNNKYVGHGSYYNTSQLFWFKDLPTTMRTAPTLEIAAGTNYYTAYRTSNADGVNTFNISTATPDGVMFQNTTEASVGSEGAGAIIYTANDAASIALKAEL